MRAAGSSGSANGRRPFTLPADPATRIARLREWNRALDLYAREV